MNDRELTIGRLAKAAQVGVETIRYYQRLNLLPTPAARLCISPLFGRAY